LTKKLLYTAIVVVILAVVVVYAMGAFNPPKPPDNRTDAQKFVDDQIDRDSRIPATEKDLVRDVAYQHLGEVNATTLADLPGAMGFTVGNLSYAEHRNFQKTDFTKVWSILKQNPEVANIRPIQALNMTGGIDYLPASPGKLDVSSLHWLEAQLLSKKPQAINQTTGEEISTVMLAHHDLLYQGMTPEEMVDAVVWNWELVPKIGERLKQNVANETDRRIVIFYKNQWPLLLYDKATSVHREGRNVTIVTYEGKEAIKVFQERVAERYDPELWKFMEIEVDDSAVTDYVLQHGFTYNRQKVLDSLKVVKGNPTELDIRKFERWWQWKGDRAHHGLWYTSLQSLKVDQCLESEVPQLQQKIKQIYDYVVYYEGEWDGRIGGLKIAFTCLDEAIAYVYPVGYFVEQGAVGIEFGIAGYTDAVIKSVNSGTYGKVLKIPGNTISILSMQEGVEKDIEKPGGTEEPGVLRTLEVYLPKKNPIVLREDEAVTLYYVRHK